MNSEPSSNTVEKEMDLFDHLRELRTRLIYSIVAIVIGSIISYFYSRELFEILARPFFASFPAESLIGTSPAEAFVLKLKAAVFAGALLASPVIFFQGWLFIAPGLYDHERRYAIPFVVISTLLFLAGVVFCYYLVLPIAFKFFLGEYRSIGVEPQIRISEQLELSLKSMGGFGLVFEMPVLAYFLARVGLVNHKMLLTYFRHAIVIIAIVAAILTPPDVLSQMLMAGPLVALYLISILIVKLTYKEREGDTDSAPVPRS